MTPLRSFLPGLLLCVGAVSAQDLLPKAAPQKRPILIRNATIHTVSGDVIQNGSIWFADGVIRQVLREGEATKNLNNPEIIDGTGKHVYPGFIGASTAVGLVELGAVRATRDHTEVGQIKPEIRAAVAVNPDSTILPVTRANGVLTVGVVPRGGLISGRASVMNLEGWTWEDMTVMQDAGVVVRWPALRVHRGRWTSRIREEKRELVLAARKRIEELFASARAYLRAKMQDQTLPTDLALEALRSAVAGKKPLLIYANEAEQIQSAIAWAVRSKLRPVILGGRDAAQAADTLRRHKVPVILDGVMRVPHRRDLAFDMAFSLPKSLQDLGIRWCLASGEEFFNERNLPYHAAKAVAHGLSRADAIRAITLSAAESLGVAAQLGSLDPGKHATLFVCAGDPLEPTGKIERAFIRGRKIDLRSKHTQLAEKYREKYRQLQTDK